MKFTLTQIQIHRLLKKIAVLFVGIVLLRLVAIFLPPLVIDVKLIAQPSTSAAVSQNTKYVQMMGLELRKSFSTTEIYFDAMQVPHANVLQWTNTRIVFFVEEVRKQHAVVHIKNREQKSNRKTVVLINNNRDTSGAILQNGAQIATPNISTPSMRKAMLEEPFSPLVLDGLDASCNRFALQMGDSSVTIPNYMLARTEDAHSIFLSDAVWFAHKDGLLDNATLEVQCQTQTFNYAIAAISNSKSSSNTVERYFILLRYIPAGNYAFLLPLQSQYQHITIDRPFIDYGYLHRGVLFTPNRINKVSVVLQNREMYYWSNADAMPILYSSEVPFRYLFEQRLLTKQLGELQVKQRIRNDADILFSEQLQALLNKPAIRNKFLLYSGNEASKLAVDPTELATAVGQLQDFVESTLQFTNTLYIEDIQALALFAPNSEVIFAENIDVLRNYVLAMLLRNTGLIARTVVGLRLEPNEQENNNATVSRPSSWTEILVKDLGWVSLSATKYTNIALYIAEEYSMLFHNAQRPLVPKFASLKQEQ